MEHMFHIQVKDEIFGEDWLKSFATEILDAKYDKADVVEVMKGLIHLDAHQKADLPWVLYVRTKRCLMKLSTFTHIRRYTLTLTQMPNLCILCLTQYLEFIWRLSNRSSTILLHLVSQHHNNRVNENDNRRANWHHAHSPSQRRP